ncbi:MAG: PEGA domain-containing protein [Planctomyces sp.]
MLLTLNNSGFLPDFGLPVMLIKRFHLLVLLILVVSQTGCVHRRFTVNTNPPGALVRVDGKDIGYSPASVDFTWYGTREIQLLKDGYETRTELTSIPAPWYQVFPLDFFSDNFLGTHTSDHRQFNFQLTPKRNDVSNDVIQRGRSLRSEAQHGR